MKYAINLLKTYGIKPLYEGIFIKISPLLLLLGIFDLAPNDIQNNLINLINKVTINSFSFFAFYFDYLGLGFRK